ncbi:Xanthine permease XanP [Hartmannibacter diazotrophicus]|uniref:Xanthine permease XanP n=1 Tax=Hartmannibacter diazotrophicus TaxID=1482074 RepID=A0A2C9D7D1_9HYPH|nr:nucleobase:cation symporter-2 family protein [Hartmannibacter diazotrophicus]SON56143.1 Xanthine permease XanP [Hartmannibacter diazotrophicus]
MANNSDGGLGLIYGLDDKPNVPTSFLAASQHILASIVGIVTPTLIIGGVLGLGEHIPYLISMSLFVSGVATFIQTHRVGPVGSGLLSLQGTSFAFLGTILAAGFAVKNNGGTPEDILAMIFGICLAGCLVEVVLSQFIGKLERIITPTVTGIVITVIGLSLVKVGFTDLAGGATAKAPEFGSLENLLLGAVVVAVILAFSFNKNPTLRISAVLIGLVVGFVIAAILGKVNFANFGNAPLFAVPIPLKYGLNFDLGLFLPMAFLYLITAIETTGDLTANSVISNQPVSGPVYMKRIKGGVLGDGINSGLAALFNTFPNTTFSQNNGVIQITGVASRHVGLFVAGILVFLGLFPIIGSVFTLIPKPVLGGATLVLFGSIAVAGIRILSSTSITRKNIYVMAVAFGLGLGVSLVPNAFDQLPALAKSVLNAPITISGLAAILLTAVLPEAEPVAEPAE